MHPSDKALHCLFKYHMFDSPKGNFIDNKILMNHWEATWHPSIDLHSLHSLDHLKSISTNEKTKNSNQSENETWQPFIGPNYKFILPIHLVQSSYGLPSQQPYNQSANFLPVWENDQNTTLGAYDIIFE